MDKIERFRVYCKDNEFIYDPKSKREEDHAKFINQFYSNPGTLGIGKVESRYREVRLIDSTGKEIGRPDIVFFNQQRDIFLIEGKSSPIWGQGEAQQLQRAYSFVSINFGISPFLIALRPRPTKGIHKRIVDPPIGDLLSLLDKIK